MLRQFCNILLELASQCSFGDQELRTIASSSLTVFIQLLRLRAILVDQILLVSRPNRRLILILSLLS